MQRNIEHLKNLLVQRVMSGRKSGVQARKTWDRIKTREAFYAIYR